MAYHYSLQEFRLVDKREAARILSVSPETLKKYRLADNSPFVAGIHYYKINARLIRYDPFLLADWVVNRHNPKAHKRSIELRLKNHNTNALKSADQRAK